MTNLHRTQEMRLLERGKEVPFPLNNRSMVGGSCLNDIGWEGISHPLNGGKRVIQMQFALQVYKESEIIVFLREIIIVDND